MREREELVQTQPMRPPVSELAAVVQGVSAHLQTHPISELLHSHHHQPATFSDESRSPTPSDEGLNDWVSNTDGNIDSVGPYSLAPFANVSMSQPELITREGVGKAKEDEDLPQMKRFKDFLRYRAGSDGYIAASDSCALDFNN